jgi:nickel transport protein
LTPSRALAAQVCKSHWRLWIVLLLSCLFTAPQVLAHKLKVFATAEGAHIQGSVYFAGGGAASGAHIEVRDAQGQFLTTLTPDPKGGFAYTAKAPIEHVLVALSADGHKAEWTVRAAELAAGFPAAALIPPVEEKPAASQDVVPPLAAVQGVEPVRLDPASLAAIEALVARQIRPLREELHAAEDRATLHDILGGVGTIFGIAGFTLWWDNRRRNPKTGGSG